jgi:GNAT superfamily N-acetyltransferase
MDVIEIRRAVAAERDVLVALQHASLRVLGRACYEDSAIEAFITEVGTMDPSLLDAGTYFAARIGSQLIGCGGWTSRSPSYADHLPGGRETAPRATIRSIYVDPHWVRRGVASVVMAAIERDIAAAGFRKATLTATVNGVPFYRRLGYRSGEPVVLRLSGGVTFVCINMEKPLAHASGAALQSAA